MKQNSTSDVESLTIASLDESDLLKLIFPHLPTNNEVIVGPGDDCAEVRSSQGSFVVSTDILIESVHFRTDWSTGYHIGWRAAMQNLADVAAMGARPTSLVVGLAMPKSTTIEWVTDFARGLGDAARSVGAACVGGDLSSSPAVFISVTVHGDPVKGSVLRSTAQPGDVVAVAGNTGWSAAGLELLLQGVDTQSLTGLTREAAHLALQTYRAPTSPIALGEVAAGAGATAMMDVSDGLIRDSQRIAKASGVRITIDFDELEHAQMAPRANAKLGEATGLEGLNSSAQGLALVDALLAFTPTGESLENANVVLAQQEAGQRNRIAKWLLTGGEDHGLLATFPSSEQIPAGFYEVGVVEAQSEGASEDSATTQETAQDEQRPVTQCGAVRVVGIELGDLESGWDHFR